MDCVFRAGRAWCTCEQRPCYEVIQLSAKSPSYILASKCKLEFWYDEKGILEDVTYKPCSVREAHFFVEAHAVQTLHDVDVIIAFNQTA